MSFNSGPSPSPSSPPTPPPTPSDEGGPSPPDTSSSTLTDIEAGADQLLSTAVSDGLSDPYSSAQGGWMLGSQTVDPYTNAPTANGSVNPFIGQDVDPYTNTPSDGGNPNAFAGGQNVDPYVGVQNTEALAGGREAGVASLTLNVGYVGNSDQVRPALPAPDLSSLTYQGIAYNYTGVAYDDNGVAFYHYEDGVGNYININASALTGPAASETAQPIRQAPLPVTSPTPPPASAPTPTDLPPPPDPSLSQGGANAPSSSASSATIPFYFPPQAGDLFSLIPYHDTGNDLLNYAVNWFYGLSNLSGALLNMPFEAFAVAGDAARTAARASGFSESEIEAALVYNPLMAGMEEMALPEALAYLGAWTSTNQSLRSLATAPAFWFVGAGGVGSGIPETTLGAQHAWRGISSDRGIGVLFVRKSEMTPADITNAIDFVHDMDFQAGGAGLVRTAVPKGSALEKAGRSAAAAARSWLGLERGSGIVAGHTPDMAGGGNPFGPITGWSEQLNSAFAGQWGRYPPGFTFDGFSLIDVETGDFLYPSHGLEDAPTQITEAIGW